MQRRAGIKIRYQRIFIRPHRWNLHNIVDLWPITTGGDLLAATVEPSEMCQVKRAAAIGKERLESLEDAG